jgi:hypothetical protein
LKQNKKKRKKLKQNKKKRKELKKKTRERGKRNDYKAKEEKIILTNPQFKASAKEK